MPVVLKFNKIKILVIKEDGGKHNIPHCHIETVDGKASISLFDLKVFGVRGISNKDLNKILKEISLNRDFLLKKWGELNEIKTK